MANRKARKVDARRKRTVVLSDDLWSKLGVEAVRRGVDRSSCAELVLSEGLRHVVIQIRGRETGQAESAA